MQPDRSCRVAVAAEKVYLSPFISSDDSTDVSCGSRERPWLLESPAGQRINISLLNFTGSSEQTTPTVERASSSGCLRQLGFIEDKSAKRNINICSDVTHRQQTLHVSQTNEVAIVLNAAQQTTRNFLIAVRGSTTLAWLFSFNKYSTDDNVGT